MARVLVARCASLFVSFPKHPEQVGRQWTDQGPDAPKRLR
jgi:hypothetical protein